MHKRSRSSQLMRGMEEGVAHCSGSDHEATRGVSDKFNMSLLVMLYAMQGVPLGLTLGSIPFILKSHASYTEVGVFSLAAYPYSMKLLWSPIVDTIFSARLGWRKSWVLPMQMASGLLMVLSADTADRWLETANIKPISLLFFIFVLLAATQDIAVDGWALTLLSRKNVGHASTCQTVGINSGYFLSFTIFLALNDPGFCNSYLRSEPKSKGVLSLANYFYFWGWIYIIITILLLFKSEKPYHNVTDFSNNVVNCTPGINSQPQHSSSDQLRSDYSRPLEEVDNKGHHLTFTETSRETSWKRKGSFGLGFGHGSLDDRVAGTIQQMGVRHMYRRLWAVASLPNIRFLTTILLISKLGSITAETVGVFKLMEKGVTREMVSLVVLIEFPLEVIFAVFGGRWASKGRPFAPWLMGYYTRLGMAAVSTCLVAMFPVGATMRSAPLFYILIILSGVVNSFASTIMFVAQGTFFARISDSSMGGSYLTLLNTIANFGSSWPKFFVFILLDWLTIQKCLGANTADKGLSLHCPTKEASNVSNLCAEAGGSCITVLDGFYPLSLTMVMLGALLGRLCTKKLHDLEVAKDDAWHA